MQREDILVCRIFGCRSIQCQEIRADLQFSLFAVRDAVLGKIKDALYLAGNRFAGL